MLKMKDHTLTPVHSNAYNIDFDQIQNTLETISDFYVRVQVITLFHWIQQI